MSLIRQRRRTLFLAGLALTTLAAGCGDAPRPIADVKGVVFFEGKPLPGYWVSFRSTDGFVATGMSDQEGRFTLKSGDREGAPVGECQVYINEPRESEVYTEAQVTNATAEDIYKMQHGGRGQKRDPEKKKLGVPPKYSLPEKSGLTATVTEDDDKNVFEFKLQK